MSQTWITLDRNASATKASTDIYNTLADAGVGVINLGQGREVDPPEGDLARFLSGEFGVNPKYNGKPMAVRAAAAAWNARMWGVPGTEKTTFIIPALGRVALDQGIVIAKKPHLTTAQPLHMLLPSKSWPVTTELGQDHGLLLTEWDVTNPDQSHMIAQNLQALRKDENGNVAVVYLNNPHNGTGIHATPGLNRSIMTQVGRSGFSVLPTVLFDEPYAHASPINNPDGGTPANPVFRSGFGDNSIALDSEVDWMRFMSGTKMLSTTFGLTVKSVSERLAPYVEKRMTRTNELGHMPALMSGTAEMMEEQNDGLFIAHQKKLGDKYRANRATLVRAFGEKVVFHDQDIETTSSMTSVMSIPKAAFGRAVKCSDGVTRITHDTNDIVEIMANQKGNEVVLVNNGNNELRFAQAAHTDVFEDGVTRVQQNLEHIMNSPMAA